MAKRTGIILFLAASLALAVQTPVRLAGETPFTDITEEAGIGFQHVDCSNAPGAGAAFLDFNNDGNLDIYVVNVEAANALYRNNGDGTFTDVAEAAGVTEMDRHAEHIGSRGVVCADYDNDGLTDLYVLNGGFFCINRFNIKNNPGRNTLYRNNGDGTFTDVTEEAGVGDENAAQCATWGDYDRDGFLDLYLGNYVRRVGAAGPSGNECAPNRLYHNNGDGTFTDVAQQLGVAGQGCTLAVSFTDYDNDGDLDLYVANDFGAEKNLPNRLYRNEGPGADGVWQFTDVSAASRANVGIYSMGIAIGDYDNDSDLDYLITNIGPTVLLSNNGDGSFTDVAQQSGTAAGFLGRRRFRVTWGAEFFDFDNDGFLDLYIASGKLNSDPLRLPNPETQPNLLFHNNRDGTFTDVAHRLHVDDPRHSRGCIVGDIDNDGDLDIFVSNLGQRPALYRNEYYSGSQGHGANNWLQLHLTGTVSPRDAIGARVSVVTGGLTQVRELGTSDPAGSMSSLVVSFGLGSSATADLIEIRWPSGALQQLRGVGVNRRLQLEEPD